MITAILSFLGLINAIYLLFHHSNIDNICTNLGCNEVLTSSFATLLGIPLSVFGVLFYGLILSAYVGQFFKKPFLKSLLVQLIFIGFLVSLTLVAIQGFIIQSWCIFCLISSAISTLLVVNLLLTKQFSKSYLFSTESIQLKLKHIFDVSIIVLLLFFTWSFYQNRAQENPIVATIGEKNYYLQEIDLKIGVPILDLKQQLYNQRLNYLENQLLAYDAKQKKQSIAILTNDLFRKNPATITEKRIQNYYQQNAHYFQNQPLDQVKNDVINAIQREHNQSIFINYLQTLKATYPFSNKLPKAPSASIQKNPYHTSYVGSKNAPFLIDFFFDFECQFCRQQFFTLLNFQNTHEKNTAIRFRHYPLSIHKGAQLKAKAAICADQNQKFLPFTKALYFSLDPKTEDELINLAKTEGINITDFRNCLRNAKTQLTVDEDIKTGRTLNLAGTPSVFVNGNYIGSTPSTEHLELLLSESL